MLIIFYSFMGSYLDIYESGWRSSLVRIHFPAQARGIWKGVFFICVLKTIFLHRLGEYRTDTFEHAVLGLIGGVCSRPFSFTGSRNIKHTPSRMPCEVSSEVSVRDHFPAHARGILNRHLRECRVRSLRRCLLETIFLHRFGEY